MLHPLLPLQGAEAGWEVAMGKPVADLKDARGCPIGSEFVRWFRNQVSKDTEELDASGKSRRGAAFTVSERQVNTRFKLMKDPKRGEVLRHLQDCGFKLKERADIESTDDEGAMFTMEWAR